MELEGKVIVITGAGRGIGRGMALVFAKKGARISLCARSKEELEFARGQAAQTSPYGEQGVLASPCGILDQHAVGLWIKETKRRFGRIDVLINNAGIVGIRTSIADYPEDVWQSVLGVNVNGPFFVTRAVLNEAMLAPTRLCCWKYFCSSTLDILFIRTPRDRTSPLLQLRFCVRS